ncbi:hypothetical protein [Microbulbifer sp. SAOS-129_SWC]|uniref:hypothetical protein n=1 Tax=Microbulbifer sp. SAOS-129_SWC TaxID=3145235 RepID=UPI0032172EE0
MSPYFAIQYIPSERVARVAFAGRLELAERVRAMRQVAEKYHHLKPLRLLVDLRYQDPSSMAAGEQRQMAEFVRTNPVLREAHIAMLYGRDYRATALVSGLVARALPNARAFMVESEAMAWLRVAYTRHCPVPVAAAGRFGGVRSVSKVGAG